MGLGPDECRGHDPVLDGLEAALDAFRLRGLRAADVTEVRRTGPDSCVVVLDGGPERPVRMPACRVRERLGLAGMPDGT